MLSIHERVSKQDESEREIEEEIIQSCADAGDHKILLLLSLCRNGLFIFK